MSRFSLALVAFGQPENYQRLGRKTQAIVDAMYDGRNCIEALFEPSAIHMEQLHRQTKSLTLEQQEKTRAGIAKNFGLNAAFDGSSSGADDSDSDYYKAIHKSLACPTIHDRCDEVADAHHKTYDWMFQNPPEGRTSWSDFVDWLREGSRIYWINGKAGSGKSTLMKYIHDNERFYKIIQDCQAQPHS